MQREAEVTRFIQPYTRAIKYAGLRTIESLKHVTATQLAAFGVPSALAQCVCKLVQELYRSWKNIDASVVRKEISIISPEKESRAQSMSYERPTHSSQSQRAGAPGLPRRYLPMGAGSDQLSPSMRSRRWRWRGWELAL